MNSCDRVDALLSEYLEEETSPAETRFFEGHLTACGRCRRQVEEMRGLLDTLSRLPRVETSADFTERVLIRTHGLEPAGLDEPLVPFPEPRRAAWVMPLAAAAALAVIVFGVSRVPETSFFGPDLAGVEAVAEDAGPVGETISAARRVPPETFGDETGPPPEVATLSQTYPDLTEGDDGAGASLGMARDAYALDDWMLREPTGGGEPVLTRVGAETSSKVMVTF